VTATEGFPENGPTLSVVVPTYREAANLQVLFERLKAALDGLPWEMIVVDDNSPDGTYNVAFAIAARNRRVRCIRRVNRSGLAGAVVEGWLASSADFVAVIDGDLQHDERILPKMYAALAADRGNLAIGARASSQGGLTETRQKLSELGAWFFRRMAGAPVNDPMSGFFMIRRDIVEKLAPRLATDGFKILVDVILSAGGRLRIVEIPYEFRSRVTGESKLNALVALDFLGLIAHHASGGLLPIRFVLFSLVGAFGLVVHLAALAAFRFWVGAESFNQGQFFATLVAMASNFALNNEITYRNYRYRGLGMAWGFLAFAIGCSVGVLANNDLAAWLYRSRQTWWLSGLAGAVLSVVWNYAVSTNLIWRPGRRP